MTLLPGGQNKTDYCGPAGDDRLARTISWLVPDTIFGVYLGCSCKRHDYLWSRKRGGPEKKDDVEFRRDIRQDFKDAERVGWAPWRRKLWRLLGFAVAWWYYIGVRMGNGAYRLRALIDNR